ncbi:hypothetical protein HY218_01020 [Candidatus Saccharibacteria bacterium]|nr:hypothetical protein [Candidatus Saccharibacteria bacterium]
MKTFEHSPLTDVYVPYIQYPELSSAARLRLVWEAIANSPIPYITRWIIYQTFRQRKFAE